MSRVQIGDKLVIENLPCGYAMYTIQNMDFWVTFDNYPTPQGTNDGITLVIAERLAALNEARVVHIIQDIWENGEGMQVQPAQYALAKQGDINEYFLQRFGEVGDSPLHLWGANVVAEFQGWVVTGITVGPP